MAHRLALKWVDWWSESVILGVCKLTDSVLEKCQAHMLYYIGSLSKALGDNSWLSVVLLVGYVHQGRRQHCICLLDQVNSLVLLSPGFAYLLTISCLLALK
jgi:hypothetical protein